MAAVLRSNPEGTQQQATRLALGLIAVHALVALVHGLAHVELGIGLSAWQTAFVGVVIGAAPLVAAAFLWMGSWRAGGALLLLSMTGALLFGAYYHFLATGPDHVASHAFTGWGAVFRGTSVLLVMTEALAVWVGARLFRRGE
jgi:hypothetical protein